MAELRYRAGNIHDPGVHKIGIIALGSHLENHGPALPIDTDAKIGAHIAFQSSLMTGAKFLGIIFPAYELDTIDHGVHVSLEVLKELLPKLEEQEDYSNDALYQLLVAFVEEKGCKNGYVMWPVRTAVSGKQMTPAGATEIMELLGKDESISRIKKGIALLESSI